LSFILFFILNKKKESARNNSCAVIWLLLSRSYNSLVRYSAILDLNRFLRDPIPLLIWRIKSCTVLSFFRVESMNNHMLRWESGLGWRCEDEGHFHTKDHFSRTFSPKTFFQRQNAESILYEDENFRTFLKEHSTMYWT